MWLNWVMHYLSDIDTGVCAMLCQWPYDGLEIYMLLLLLLLLLVLCDSALCGCCDRWCWCVTWVSHCRHASTSVSVTVTVSQCQPPTWRRHHTVSAWRATPAPTSCTKTATWWLVWWGRSTDIGTAQQLALRKFPIRCRLNGLVCVFAITISIFYFISQPSFFFNVGLLSGVKIKLTASNFFEQVSKYLLIWYT